MLDQSKIVFQLNEQPSSPPPLAVVPAGAVSPQPDLIDVGEPLAPRMDAPAEGAAGPSALQFAHRLLRGRYQWAVMLGLAGAAIGGVAGFRSGTRYYQSTGQIRVLPVLPKVLYRNEENDTIPMFDDYVEAQVALIRSQRVVAMAMQSDAWQAIRRGTSDADLLKFNGQLAVTRQGDMIQVSFMDPDPAAAMTATKAVVDSYQKVYSEQDAVSGKTRLELLQERQAAWTDERDSLRRQILAVANQYGSDDLSSVLSFRQSEANKLEASMRDLELAIAAASGQADRSHPQTQPSAGDLSIADITALSEQMRAYVGELEACRHHIVDLQAHDVLEQHPEMITARAMLRAAQKQVDDYAAEFRSTWASRRTVGGSDPSAAELKGMSVEALKERYGAVKRLYDKAQQELLALGREDLHIKELQGAVDAVQQKINEVKSRLEQLDVEAALAGRLNVISAGDRPLEPARDTRKSLAATNGMAGGLAGVAIVAAFGFFSRGLRRPHDAPVESMPCPMLGVLPALSEDMSDTDQIALAAHGVHGVRALLQIWGGQRGIFGVTSPLAGSGKTSLSLALGVSFAGAGARTLLIDADLIGGGLTSRMNVGVRRRIGRILRDRGLLSDAQLHEALAEAKKTRRTVGEVLLSRGLVLPADLEQALGDQRETEVGLMEALGGRPLEECVASSGIRNLAVLGLGAASPDDAGALSPASINTLLRKARQKYDAIIVDTGPMPGSLEASIVAPAVDGMILAVARGEDRNTVARCLKQLKLVDAAVAGIVFNRARGRDVVSYGSASSTRGSYKRAEPVRAGGTTADTFKAQMAARLGPLPGAVIYAGKGADDAPAPRRVAGALVG